MPGGAPLLLPALAALALVSGCGGDAATTTGQETPVETADSAKLPADWQRHTNFDVGVSLGLPPLWRASDHGISTTIHSPDRLLAITVSADRTREAIELDLEVFAERVAGSLAGYESLAAGQAKPFGHAHTAVSVRARGATSRGVDQDVLVVVIDREGLVKVTALAAWNRAKTPGRDVRDAERILRTVRTRPVA